MFVPYSRITASVSLYTTSHSPFLPVYLSSRRPLTIFFFLRPLSFPYFSLLFLSSLLSRAHISLIFLSFLQHFSRIPHRHPPLSQTGSYKVRQEKEAGGSCRQSQQAVTNNGQEIQGRNRARQDNIRYRKGQAKTGKGRKAENGSSPKNCRKAAESLPAPSSHHTPAPRSLHPFSSAPAGQQDNGISCEFQEQAEIG